MKKTIPQQIILAIILLTLAGQSFAYTCTDLNGAYLYSQEYSPKYLGFFGSSFAYESVNNWSGPHGSSSGFYSVRNPSGTYGSSSGYYSANNNTTQKPPGIYKYGSLMGHLTTNSIIYDGVPLAVLDADCTFTASSPSFSAPTTYTLSVSKSGSGTGTVISTSGIDCGSDCSQSYNAGTTVSLSAIASSGSTFAGWSGCSSGNHICHLPPMTGNVSVTAAFSTAAPTQYELTVWKSGTGSGTVTSSPSGVNCGSDCNQYYNSGTPIALTASPASGSTFAGWSGACSGTGSCNVTMNSAKSVTATFSTVAPTIYNLSVGKFGEGSGIVTSSPSGISCGSDCSQSYNSGTVVALTASALSGSTFSGWSGACSGTGSCQVTMNATKSVIASFSTVKYNLSVSKSGTGTGTVTSSPSGISCGSDCNQSYNVGTLVTLSASAASSSSFTGWSGACSGTNTCQITMNAAKSVTATFNPSSGMPMPLLMYLLNKSKNSP